MNWENYYVHRKRNGIIMCRRNSAYIIATYSNTPQTSCNSLMFPIHEEKLLNS